MEGVEPCRANNTKRRKLDSNPSIDIPDSSNKNRKSSRGTSSGSASQHAESDSILVVDPDPDPILPPNDSGQQPSTATASSDDSMMLWPSSGCSHTLKKNNRGGGLIQITPWKNWNPWLNLDILMVIVCMVPMFVPVTPANSCGSL